MEFLHQIIELLYLLVIAANLVCWSLLCFVMRRGSRNKSAQLVPLVPAPTGTSDKSPKATQDSIGDIQTELSTTGTQVPNDKLAALNGSQAVEGSPQAVPKTQGVALSNGV